MQADRLLDDNWHHVCFTWRNFDGRWCLYIDGNQEFCEAGYKTGEVITGNGLFIVGQEQDKLGKFPEVTGTLL